MWTDDRHWFPQLLAGEPFAGLVAFDAAGEEMATCAIDTGVTFERPVAKSR